MANTPHLGITLLEQAQAQKEVTVNEALARIDAVLNSGVIDRDLATPPGSPAAGDVYIVAASGTGAWSGKSGYVAYFDQIWRFITPREGLMLWVNDENTHVVYDGAAWQVVTYSGGGGGGGSGIVPLTCEGRLTLTSATPVTTSNVTAAGTVYFTPHMGNRIGLYDGTDWQMLTFSELNLSLASGYSSGKPYDVFAYINSGAVALETLVWTNDTTRATGLTRHDGVLVKSGAQTRRYLGTFYTTSATTTEDSAHKRFVWNYYNRVARPWFKQQTSVATWNYTSATIRQANADSGNQLDCVVGRQEDASEIVVACAAQNSSAGVQVMLGIGINSTTVSSAQQSGGNCGPASSPSMIHARLAIQLPLGRNYFAWLESSAATGTTTWVSYSGNYISSIMGSFKG